jgi:hypothetical protein
VDAFGGPIAPARLVQCLIEDVEAAPETLTAALELTVFFADGCRKRTTDWPTLLQGLYGEELRRHAWKLYSGMQWPEDIFLMHTCAAFTNYSKPTPYWLSAPGLEEKRRLLASEHAEDIAQGLLRSMGLFWNHNFDPPDWKNFAPELQDLERYVFNDAPTVWAPAVWLWQYVRWRLGPRPGSPRMLDRLTTLWLRGPRETPLTLLSSIALM